MPDLPQTPVQPQRTSFALRILGTALLMGSIGLVSCQALFTL